VRHAEDGARAADLRVAVQRTMQAHAAVFRTSEPLCEGIEKMDGMTEGRSDVGLADRPPIWNAGLVEALDLDDLIGDAPTTIRGAHAREDCPERDGRNRPKHALVRMDGNCRVSPDRCGVKMRTPTDGVQVFPPRPRVC
jgi:succinate dehydrogenase / fumarate reductase flavoprotein subunit